MIRFIFVLLLLSGVAYAEKLRFYGAGGAGPPSAGCDGTIDLSTGCAQPMLGGL